MINTSIWGIAAPTAAGVTTATLTGAPWWVTVVGIGASVIMDLYHRRLTHQERLAVLATGSAEHCAAILNAMNEHIDR